MAILILFVVYYDWNITIVVPGDQHLIILPPYLSNLFDQYFHPYPALRPSLSILIHLSAFL